MKTKDGELVNAVYGFASVLLNVIFKEKPDHIVVAFDRAAPTHRHQAFKDYKANRPKAPDELYAQLPRVKEFLQTFPLTILEKDGFEADDIIATLAEKHKLHKKVIILSGDRDLFQLIDENVVVSLPKKGFKENVIYDADQLKKDYGLDPSQITDFKGLCGDLSDNIPGVSGIGHKTALKLLRDYQTLDHLYKNIDKIPGKLGEKLKTGQKDAYFSKELATLSRYVPLEYDLDKTQTKNFDWPKVAVFLEKLHFPSLLNRLKIFLPGINENNPANNHVAPVQTSLF